MRWHSSLLVVSLLAACVGDIGESGMDPPPIDPLDPPPGFCDDAPPMLGEIPIRRLSQVEYRNSVRDLLFGLDVAFPSFPADVADGGFENSSRYLGAPALLVEAHQVGAADAAQAAVAERTTLERILGCASWTTPAEQFGCTQSFVRGFGSRAFRRPLSADEESRYVAFIEEKTALIDYEAAIELALAAFMQSPQFNYRVEIGDAGRLSSHEMASRLSYFLWQSMPDEELFAAAAAGELATPAQREAQARRMMDLPPARQAMVDFHRQWLDFDAVLEDEHLRKNADLYPGWNPALIASVREEVDRFVDHVMFEGEGTLEELLTSRTAFVDGPLAAQYGVDAVDDWTQIELPAGERSGILTRANFLASHAHQLTGSPILRGVFVNQRLLCVSFGAVPDDADTSEPVPEPGAGPQTNRMVFEQRTQPRECQACHQRIDGIGFAFENYDATGAFRDEDNMLPVDARGELFGTDTDGTYDGAIELSERIASSSTLDQCAAQNWVRYSLGRPLAPDDACFVQSARRSLEASGGSVRELMIDLVASDDFARGL